MNSVLTVFNMQNFQELCSLSESANEIESSEISGFHGGEYEDDCLLGCCAV
jgi:hypothetical protein